MDACMAPSCHWQLQRTSVAMVTRGFPSKCQEHGCYMVLLATGTSLKVDHIDLDAPMEVYIVMLCNDC
jgi:hypothetical protein